MICCIAIAAGDIITTIAGTGTGSYSGDNGQATAAALNNPTTTAIDALGSRIQKNRFT